MQIADETPQPAHTPLRVNGPAPDFQLATTQGPRTLADFVGRWLVMFSHQSDFRPVCATEFIAFANHYDAFQKLNCEVMAVSADSLGSHMAWLWNFKEKFNTTIPFPFAADPARKTIHAYNMLAQVGPGQLSPGRATFIIDDKSVLRAMLYYPVPVARSVAEILRLVTALQVNQSHSVAIPEGWHPGDKVLLPPPSTLADAEARLQAGTECIDWYFCRKEI